MYAKKHESFEAEKMCNAHVNVTTAYIVRPTSLNFDYVWHLATNSWQTWLNDLIFTWNSLTSYHSQFYSPKLFWKQRQRRPMRPSISSGCMLPSDTGISIDKQSNRSHSVLYMDKQSNHSPPCYIYELTIHTLSTVEYLWTNSQVVLHRTISMTRQ